MIENPHETDKTPLSANPIYLDGRQAFRDGKRPVDCPTFGAAGELLMRLRRVWLLGWHDEAKTRKKA